MPHERQSQLLNAGEAHTGADMLPHVYWSTTAFTINGPTLVSRLLV